MQQVDSTDTASKLKEKWHDIARELSQEQDPERLSVLMQELNDAMLAEERAKAKQKLGLRGSRSPSP